jgi:hypothetical protein
MSVFAVLWSDRAYIMISMSPPLCQDRSSGWATGFGLGNRTTGGFFFIER